MNKLLTVAIPTRNRGQYLIETIDSIIKQEVFTEIEIVVCDNDSEDDTKFLMKKYKEYQNIKYYENTQLLTIDDNMIKVASLVATKYFLWLGDDDLIVDGGLSKILTAISANEHDFVLLNAMSVTEKLDKRLGNTIKINNDILYNTPKEFFLKHCFHMPFGTLIVRKELYESVIEENKRFKGTSHAYSGLVFDYLAKKYLIYKKVDILIISEELILLRQIKKTWANNATKIIFQEIPEWFLLLDNFYKNEVLEVLDNYIDNQFRIKNLIIHRRRSQLNIHNFFSHTKYASYIQKIKYILVSLIPFLGRT